MGPNNSSFKIAAADTLIILICHTIIVIVPTHFVINVIFCNIIVFNYNSVVILLDNASWIISKILSIFFNVDQINQWLYVIIMSCTRFRVSHLNVRERFARNRHDI